MKFQKAFIPYGGYWSTPFCKWQGSFQNLHSMIFAAEVAKGALAERRIPEDVFDGIVLGMTIPQTSCFYGAPWVAGMMGATRITGPTISQACATSARCVAAASHEIESGEHRADIIITCDRCSNGPHLYYPDPSGPGGTGKSEDWVWDNFGNDPFARNSMIQTAENVAREAGISREIQDEVALMRYHQYQDALKDDMAFLRRFMVIPTEVKDAKGRVMSTVKCDEGVYPTTAEGLRKLKPVLPGGTVTFGSQTYPADANVGMIIATREKARELSREPGITVQVLSYAQGRAKKGYMAMAIVPAARLALRRAGVKLQDVKVIKTHNPFAVNDVYFSQEMGVKLEDMNNYGSSLIWGHPQGPTGLRLIIEMIEELVIKGGGYGLFDGCAAGDSAAAVVLKVDVT
jgi:acetyl-CoA acetyltransferase family protein